MRKVKFGMFVMMTFYMVFNGYGPAANVTGDGAVALACERIFGMDYGQ